MKYTLITNTGKIMRFYLLVTAEVYQNIYGGNIITEEILEAQELPYEV